MLKQFMWYCVDADGEKNSKVTKSAVCHCGIRGAWTLDRQSCINVKQIFTIKIYQFNMEYNTAPN